MLIEKMNELLSHLPNSPYPILIVGRNSEAFIPKLTQHSIVFAHFSQESEQNLEKLDFDHSSAIVDSYCYIAVILRIHLPQLLTLFHQAHSLLTPDGKFLLIGEVSLQKLPEDTDESPPHFTYVVAHAQRCGFQLQQSSEISQNSANHHLVASEWIKTDSPRWKIERVTPEERDSIIALFNQVFKPNQMSAAFWEWKYGQGRGLGILAWHHHRLVAHYGGILREIRYFGQPKTAVQITDVMVDVKERGVLTRQGAFFLVTATFLENYIGYGARTWIGYGFPSHRHVKLAEHLGLYATVGEVVELRWPPLTAKPHFWSRIRHLQKSSKIQKVVDQLWDKMAVTLRQALVGVRDWSYLHHRYLLHPDKRYELLLISRRFTGQALAVVVIYRENDTCKIMDFIGDIRFIPLAVYQIRQLASQWGLRQIHVWITQNFVTAFPSEQLEQHRLGIYVPHNTWAQSFSPTVIENCWWLMAGDTDFL
jgi:hypothetical protein